MANEILSKSYRFSVRIVKLCNYIRSNKQEHSISRQLVRSGTSICANVVESQDAQSRPDFISKLSIALKETSETLYWLHLLLDTNYLTPSQFRSIEQDCIEIRKLLIAILKSTKN